jgi:hypothetical protein
MLQQKITNKTIKSCALKVDHAIVRHVTHDGRK